jgi:hypothetical protein
VAVFWYLEIPSSHANTLFPPIRLITVDLRITLKLLTNLQKGVLDMPLTAVASDDEREEQSNQASQADNLPAVRSDWRKRGGVDRLPSSSAAAVTEALFHNSALLFRSVGYELAGIDDLAERITSTRPGLAYHLAGFEDMLVQAWKCKMAQYLNCGRP